MNAGFAQVKQALAVSLVLAVFVHGCRSEPIREVVETSLPNACSAASDAEIDEAIWRAGRKAGWEVEQVAPRVQRATWRFKRHVAVVTITHANGRASIRYEESDYLLRKDDRIHRSYNRHVERLAARIQAEPVAAERCRGG